MSLLPIVFQKDFEFVYALSFYVEKFQNFSINQMCLSVLNPFKPDEFFHSYYFEKSIVHLRGVRLIFSSLA